MPVCAEALLASSVGEALTSGAGLSCVDGETLASGAGAMNADSVFCSGRSIQPQTSAIAITISAIANRYPLR